MRAFFIAVCLLSATACAGSPTDPTTPLDARFTLGPSETAVIDDGAVVVQFLGVTNDSRCPGDALCIQGGDAIVAIGVTDVRPPIARYELHTGDSSRGVARHRDLRIELIELQPYPFGSQPFTPDKYRATLRVTR
jgi:hypothetical protein